MRDFTRSTFVLILAVAVGILLAPIVSRSLRGGIVSMPEEMLLYTPVPAEQTVISPDDTAITLGFCCRVQREDPAEGRPAYSCVAEDDDRFCQWPTGMWYDHDWQSCERECVYEPSLDPLEIEAESYCNFLESGQRTIVVNVSAFRDTAFGPVPAPGQQIQGEIFSLPEGFSLRRDEEGRPLFASSSCLTGFTGECIFSLDFIIDPSVPPGAYTVGVTIRLGDITLTHYVNVIIGDDRTLCEPTYCCIPHFDDPSCTYEERAVDCALPSTRHVSLDACNVACELDWNYSFSADRVVRGRDTNVQTYARRLSTFPSSLLRTVRLQGIDGLPIGASYEEDPFFCYPAAPTAPSPLPVCMNVRLMNGPPGTHHLTLRAIGGGGVVRSALVTWIVEGGMEGDVLGINEE